MLTPPHPLVAAALCACLLSGCSSTRRADDGGALGRSIRVSVLIYGSQGFELASQSHTAPVNLYSEVRPDASSKVQVDEVMEALVEHLEDLGYDGYARSGSAPSSGGEAITRAIEVYVDGVTTFWGVGSGTSPDERAAFNECVRGFISLFNQTQGFQSVDNELGARYFEAKEGQRRTKRD